MKRIAGAVLCGGASRRMGRDKALMSFEGTPMVMRVADTLRSAGCDPVVAIGGDHSALATLGLNTVADQWPGEGPCGAVLTALAHFADHDAVVIVACDLPRLSARAAKRVIDALSDNGEEHDVAIAVTGERHSACMAWRLTTAPQLATTFAGGARKLLDAMDGLRVVEVVVDKAELMNVNTPDDLSN